MVMTAKEEGSKEESKADGNAGAGADAPTTVSETTASPSLADSSTNDDAAAASTTSSKMNQNAEPSLAVLPVADESQSCRVYVGNLAWEITSEDLNEFIKTTLTTATTATNSSSSHEVVVVRSDIMRSMDGRSKGCGIVEFATAEGAKQAMLTLNDKEFQGRQIFVREDREGRRLGGRSDDATATFHNNNTTTTSGGDDRATTGSEQAQSRRVYVGNLSWDVDWPILKDHMRQAGEVLHVDVICETNNTGRSKGCGIVEYATKEGAHTAMETLTHTELNGRTIFVREDRETSSSSGSAAGAGAGAGAGFATTSNTAASTRSNHHYNNNNNNTIQNSTSVYVWNLSYETSWQELKDHCRKAGNVDQATILTTSGDGTSNHSTTGSGIVVYQKPGDAARAIRELQDSELNGRPIKLREDRKPSGGSGGRGGRGRGGGGRFGGRGQHRSHGGGGGSGRGSFPGSTTPGPTTPSSSNTSGTQLFVGNLSYDANWRDLKELFQQCGPVDRADVRGGFGTIRFTKKDDAERAIQTLNGVELKGRALEVRLDQKAYR